MPDFSTFWPDEDTATLIALWPTHSAAQIAAKLHRSRGAVCGVAHRLRVDGRLPRRVLKHYEVVPYHKQPGPPRRRRAIAQLAPYLDDPASNGDCPAMQPCSIQELDDRRCHWPLGGLHQVALQFCGGEVVRGRRYCAHHARMSAKG